jgi:hypothetical protein
LCGECPATMIRSSDLSGCRVEAYAYARSGLLDHLNSDGFDYRSDWRVREIGDFPVPLPAAFHCSRIACAIATSRRKACAMPPMPKPPQIIPIAIP